MGLKIWGNQPRYKTKSPWRNVRKWNAAAAQAGEMRRVFCASMADVFEDHAQLPPWRDELWGVIRELRSLSFLLLTKRPENIASMLPKDLWGSDNIWLGTTVESSDYLWRAEELLKLPAVVRFVSCEPQMEAIDFRPLLGRRRISWVIAGGESKQGKDHEPRQYDLAWARSIVRQCRSKRVWPFVKQFGSRPIENHVPVRIRRAGTDPGEWPADLRVQEFPIPTKGRVVR
jgi:protein gp37